MEKVKKFFKKEIKDQTAAFMILTAVFVTVIIAVGVNTIQLQNKSIAASNVVVNESK